MTYIITPYNRAYPVRETSSYDIYEGTTFCVVQMALPPRYDDWVEISPRYMYEEYAEDDDGKDAAMYEAVKWLEDLLVRLSTNPVVINCTTDGEQFVR